MYSWIFRKLDGAWESSSASQGEIFASLLLIIEILRKYEYIIFAHLHTQACNL